MQILRVCVYDIGKGHKTGWVVGTYVQLAQLYAHICFILFPLYRSSSWVQFQGVLALISQLSMIN